MPTDGSAATSFLENRRVIRGGDFNAGEHNGLLHFGSAWRWGSDSEWRMDTVGFRVAKSLP
jgi:hypothetical protein